MATPTSMSADLLRQINQQLNESVGRSQTLLISPRMKQHLVAEFEASQPVRDLNPIYAGYSMRYVGLPVEVVDIPPEEVIDWSGCRSPARAKRRRALGHPQRVKITHRERAYVVESRSLAMKMQSAFERMALGLINQR